MNNPEVSIVIPAYNAAKYIGDSITSVVNQTLSSWELIVVDDGSTDKTTETLSSFAKDPRITVIRQRNSGVSAARNTGIDKAKGKYIAFLDADDAWLPSNLAEKVKALDNNPSADFVYCDVIRCDEKLNEEGIQKAIEPNDLFNRVMAWEAETIPTLPSNIMVKTGLMKEKFRFDENLSNCADRYMKILLSKSARAIYLPLALVKYRNAPGSMSKNAKLLEKDEEYIIRKIISENIMPEGAERKKVIANIYLTISGSWYRNGGKFFRSVYYALKSIATYPPIIKNLAGKFR